MGLSDADDRQTIARFLERNAGMSFVERTDVLWMSRSL